MVNDPSRQMAASRVGRIAIWLSAFAAALSASNSALGQNPPDTAGRQQLESDLAKQSQNPVANLISMPLQYGGPQSEQPDGSQRPAGPPTPDGQALAPHLAHHRAVRQHPDHQMAGAEQMRREASMLWPTEAAAAAARAKARAKTGKKTDDQ